ncbi:hypothetical protein HPB48_007080 [Haemaphysalis longicornis]|uniref:Uncharacterized protein n=1 Tax=Haemaphysalis longicornis TaxID=44386 RepID=A0A9J6FRS7_HAELO|nr:hypothetical protein HPB48_007080 [Haemaphysalis longicornis]
MASTSSQPNAAVTQNRFAALAMEDMELGADESKQHHHAVEDDGGTQQRRPPPFIAVQGSDLNPRGHAGWKFTATKQEERKVIMRPRGGLCLARLEVDVVLSAVITAASVAKTVAMADTICTNPTQNIIVVSTPDEDRANKYANVRSLYIGSKNYETYAYRTAPHDTCQRCKKARATQSHILWECSPPAPNTQDNELPDEICSKLISTELGNQRAVVQHVLELLDRQKPGTSSRLRDNG